MGHSLIVNSADKADFKIKMTCMHLRSEMTTCHTCNIAISCFCI